MNDLLYAGDILHDNNADLHAHTFLSLRQEKSFWSFQRLRHSSKWYARIHIRRHHLMKNWWVICKDFTPEGSIFNTVLSIRFQKETKLSKLSAYGLIMNVDFSSSIGVLDLIWDCLTIQLSRDVPSRHWYSIIISNTGSMFTTSVFLRAYDISLPQRVTAGL